MAKIAILEFEQTPDVSPIHFVSKGLAEKFRQYCPSGRQAVTEVRKGLLWIRVNMTFAQLKALFRQTVPSGPAPIPQILPPRPPDWLFTAYPIADQRSSGIYRL